MAKRVRLQDDSASSRGYFDQEDLAPPREFIHTGSVLLDCVLGGGYPLGRVVNIVGDKSTGKCGKNFHICSEQGLTLLDTKGQESPLDFSVWEQEVALDANTLTRSSHVYKERVSSTIKIRTQKGYELEGTPNHPILVWTPACTVQFTPLRELAVDDVVVISKAPQQPDRKEVLIPFAWEAKRMVRYKSCQIPTHATEAVGTFLGLFVADGCFAGTNITFANRSPWFLQELTRACQEAFAVTPISKESGTTVVHKVCQKQLYAWMDLVLGGRAKKFTARYKCIPACILASPSVVQAAFLRALIDCDSWFHKGAIYYYTASTTLANQVHLLLLLFGVIATKSCRTNVRGYEGHSYWTISIHGKYVNQYLRVVGSVRCPTLQATDLAKSDYDSIPFVKDRLNQDKRRLQEQLGWSKNGRLRNGQRFPKLHFFSDNVTWSKLQEFCEVFCSYREELRLAYWEELIQKQYCFDRIIQVEHVEQGTEVYDLHIPQMHAFWANGFINHNTLLGMEALANFFIQYPKGKALYLEAEAAFDEAYARQLGIPVDKIEFNYALNTVEDFFKTLETACKALAGKTLPGMVILDSLDSLSDDAELERDIDKGSYGSGKAKKMSELFRRLIRQIRQTRLCVIIISQVRDNIGVVFGKKYSRSGGHAMDFYVSQVIYLAHLKQLTMTRRGQRRAYGVRIKALCEKNKVGVPFRTCEFDIQFGYGIRDLESCEEFLEVVKYPGEIKQLSDKDLQTVTRQEWAKLEQEFAPTDRKY